MPGLFNPNGSPPERKKSGGLFAPTTTEPRQPSSGGLFQSSATAEPDTTGSGGLFKAGAPTLDIYKKEQNNFDTKKLDVQIGNAKLRVEKSGGKVKSDTRNRVEKALNLPEKQNWLFDTLEVLGRPQQAIFGGIDAIYKTANGEPTNRDEAFMKGLKGDSKIKGKDIVNHMLGEMGIKGRKGTGAAGFAVDVTTDPLNALPVGALTKVGKEVGALGKGALKGAIDGLEMVVPSVKRFRETKVEPILDSVKDGLGHMFVPKYKWDETLSGGKDDFLKNKFTQTENDIRYMNDESLKGVSGSARSAGGIDTGTDVGRLMEKDLVMHGPRPMRQYSSDPKITQAADTLMKSNTELRQWALDNDIPVGEVEGYMRHIWSQEEAALQKLKKGKNVDVPRSGMNNPDKKVLNQRELQGSVEDINQQLGRKFFEPNAFFSSAIGQKKLIEYGNAVKFRRDVLANPDFAEKFAPGTPVSPGQVVINTNNYKFLSNASHSLPDEIGGEYLVTHGVKQALDRYQKLTTDPGINAFLKMYDKGLGNWKKLTLLSGPYHIRNDIGGKFNNYVGGMDIPDILKYTPLATKDVTSAVTKGKETPLFTEFKTQGLGSTSQMAIEFSKHGEDIDKAMRKIVKDESRTGVLKAAGVLNPFRIFKTSQEAGTFIDQTNRFALYRWAREAKGMTPEQAAAKVKEVQFDYSNLTPFEREVAVRTVPFYRWMRNNIPFQLRQFASDPVKYANTNKLYQSLQREQGIDEQNVPDYMRNNFYAPISGDGKGNGKMLSLNLPAGDLTKLNDPGKILTDSLTPFKTLIELAQNRNWFKNKDIQQFAGQQTKYRLPDSLYGMKLPGAGKGLGGLPIKTAYALEQFGGQPARALSKMLAVPTAQQMEDNALKPSLGIGSMVKPFSVEENAYWEKFAELRKLQDQLKVLEQEQGIKPLTVREIKKGITRK